MGLGPCWYALAGCEVIGPFATSDAWYHENAGPDWRHGQRVKTGVDPWSVGYDKLADGRTVSTVFLGLDHRMWMSNDGPPEVFETMVFPDCEVQERCCTWADAVEMHARALARFTPVE